MASVNKHNNHQVYNVREDERLLDQVAIVTCVLMQRGLWIAGYNSNRQLLTIHFYSYNSNKPVWEIEFFEQLFGNEPLLAGKGKVKGVFLCTHRSMVIPARLYDAEHASLWLARLHLIESTDEAVATHLTALDAHHYMAIPVTIPALIKINFRKAETLPFPMHHFSAVAPGHAVFHCSILPAQCVITLYREGKLHWHHTGDYTNASDIIYEIKHYCRENNIDDADAKYIIDAATAKESGMAREFSRFFPNTVTADGSTKLNSNWDASVALANQLIACV